MTILVTNFLLDADIDLLIANGEKVHLLTAYEDDYATIIGADGSMGNFTPTITKEANEAPKGGGQKAKIAAKSGVVIATVVAETDETFTHFAVLDITNTRVLYVGEGTDKILSNGDSISTPDFFYRRPDAIETP